MAALGGAAEMRAEETLAGFLWRFGSALAGAPPGHYGRGRCVMSRAARLKSAADQSSRLVLTPRLPVCHRRGCEKPKTGPDPMTQEIVATRCDKGSPAREAGVSVSRRVFMNSVAVLPIVATPSIAHSLDQLPPDDRRLVELAARVESLQPAYQRACDACEAAWDAYLEQKPQRPSELAWRPGDPVNYDIDQVDITLEHPYQLQRRGRLWCSDADIEKLRGKPLMRWDFVGTDEEWERDESHRFDRDRRPLPQCAHLWREIEDHERQPRADELVAALDRWQLELEELRRKLRVDELDERSEQLHAELRAMWKKMLELRATTLEGVQAKARVLYRSIWNGDPRDQLGGGDCTDARLIFGLIADLTGEPVERLALGGRA